MLYDILLWLHLLCMVGAFGGLLHWRLAGDSSAGLKTVRLAAVLVGIGFLFGLTLYVLKMQGAGPGMEITAHQHMLIGIKFILLLVIGALLGIASKKLKSDKPAGPLVLVTIIIMAITALLGVLI